MARFFLPGLPKPGGFTITSTPRNLTSSSENSSKPYLELAVQNTSNPPAQFLWQPLSALIGLQFVVRVGGDFTYPPPASDGKLAPSSESIKRLVLVAGGVGINPLVSILSHLHETNKLPPHTILLYGVKATKKNDDQDILFFERLKKIAVMRAGREEPVVDFSLFVTGSEDANRQISHSSSVHYHSRRMKKEDILAALGPSQTRKNTIIYICGPRGMTDEFVELCENAEGMKASDPGGPGRVRCERWW